MPALAEYESRVRALCLDADPSDEALARLGDDAFRWLRYRRMVRRRLTDAIEQALPRLAAELGAEALMARAALFFASGAPRSLYIREVPGEFVAWLLRDGNESGVPAFLLDLARLEWAERSVRYAEDSVLNPPAGPLTMNRPAVLSSATRLLSLEHAVHVPRGDAPSPVRAPTFLCVYRDPSTHEARTLELTRSAHALLSLLPNRTLSSAIERAAAEEGVAVAQPFLEATSQLLADLLERGVLLGSLDG